MDTVINIYTVVCSRTANKLVGGGGGGGERERERDVNFCWCNLLIYIVSMIPVRIV